MKLIKGREKRVVEADEAQALIAEGWQPLTPVPAAKPKKAKPPKAEPVEDSETPSPIDGE